MHERLTLMRREAPIYWDATNKLWVLSRYEDIAAVSKNAEIFCSGAGTRPVATPPLSIIDMDGQRHRDVRGLVNRGFTPNRVARLAERFRDRTRDTMAKVAARGGCDFVADVAAPLPLHLIAEMIGIEPDRFADFQHWSDGMMAAARGDDSMEAYNQGVAAAAEYSQYLTAIIEDRSLHPRDDLISVLVGARKEGALAEGTIAEPHRVAGDEEIAGSELMMFLVLLLVAGNETTRNALTGGISALIENPAQFQKLVDDPSRITTAVDEIVRYVTPVLNFVQTATRDTVLRGQTIAKGQRVLLVYPSANRDEQVFQDADHFDVERAPNPHLGFGVGSHFCLGANLARMGIRIVLEELVARFSTIEYIEGPPRIEPHGLVRSYASMPVRLVAN